MNLEARIKARIREIPDFPKPGILFKDITPVFADPELCREITKDIAETYQDIDVIAGIESRGFFWGMAVAQYLNIPFIPIRKAGKLPSQTLSQSYDLEYGSASIEIHADAIQSNWKVLIHDDLLATGGTAEAAAKLVNQLGVLAGFSFLVELKGLKGREKLRQFGASIDSLVKY